MTQKMLARKADGSLTKMPGWFSWRHRTNEEHLAANVGRSRAETKARKRAEAEARNAAADAGQRYCGHVHGRTGQRCGVAR